MRKRFKILAAAVAAGVFLTGCELPEESPGELMGVSAATEAATVAAETAPVAEPTEAPAEDAAPFEVGQQVFAVYEHAGGLGVRRFFFVGLEGDTVTVTTAIPGSGEEGELLRFPVADCYADSADAWAAVGKEPLE